MWSVEDDVILSAASFYMENIKTKTVLHQKTNNHPPEFQMAQGDSISEDCGRIFITINRMLIFHCTFCNKEYGTLFDFLQHIASTHIEDKMKKPVYVEENIKQEPPHSKLGDGSQFTSEEATVKKAPSPSNHKNKNKLAIKRKIPKKNEKLNETVKLSEIEGYNSDYATCRVEIKNENEIPTIEGFKLNKKNPLKCNKCDRILSTIQAWKNHIFSHSNDCNECPICKIPCKKQNLKLHIQRHTNARKHACEVCGKKFFTGSELRIHVRIHTGEQPYTCAKCGKTFKSSGNLSEHFKRRHENFRPKKCEICGMCFYNNGALKNHMACHSDERPYGCTSCPSRFARKKTLKLHMKLHSNDRKYSCNLCEKSYIQRSALMTHINSHHKN